MTTVDPFGLAPEEAVRWFREKGYALSFDWRDYFGKAHARAFTVAKATQLDILADIREAVDHAIRHGGTLGEFKKGLKPTLQAKGWWGEKEMVDPKTGEQRLVQLGSASRLRTIYETNLRQAQAAGRGERMERVKARRPYGRYVAVMDGRERAEHRAWHGTVLPLDDPWWDEHMPPNGWGCRCKVQQLSDRDLERYGFKVSDEAPRSPKVAWKNDRTGETVMVPRGIDPGFNYNPGKAQRGFTPPDDSAPVLHPVQTFADMDRPRARDVPADERRVQPPSWPEVKSPADRAAAEQRLAELFGVARGAEGVAKDPQGVEITFPPSLLDYLVRKEPARTKTLPSAKATIEDPYEIWMVPFRLRDGRVVMRKRYIGLFDGPQGQQLVVVNRTDEGHAAHNSFPHRGIDGQREGYLLYARPKR